MKKLQGVKLIKNTENKEPENKWLEKETIWKGEFIDKYNKLLEASWTVEDFIQTQSLNGPSEFFYGKKETNNLHLLVPVGTFQSEGKKYVAAVSITHDSCENKVQLYDNVEVNQTIQ
jgi:hypothetical protein